MKTIIKLVIALLVLVGCVNVGRAILSDYQFEESVHEGLLFDPRMTDAEIVQLVMKAAAEHDVPIEASDVTVRQVGPEVNVDMAYTKTVSVIPGVFEKEWSFTPSASTRLLVGQRRQP